MRFIGTYASQPFSEDKSILFMGAENTLYYPLDGASLGAQRAYFKIGEDGAQARQLTAFNIGFGEGEATGILELKDGKIEELFQRVPRMELMSSTRGTRLKITNLPIRCC